MRRRTLLVLLGALVMLVVVAGVILTREPTRGRRQEQALLQPGLKGQLNEIRQIVLTGPGNKTIATLEQGASSWTVAERSNYPADVRRIRRNLLALADARLVEEKTSSPDNYARLGVEDPDSPAAGGVQLTITDGKTRASIIVGLPASGNGGQTYVRRKGEAASWLVAGQFDLGRTAGEWLDQSLTDIPAQRIQSVTISHPGLPTVRIQRPASSGGKASASSPTEFLVSDVPPGRELSYPGVGNGVASALADLRLEDVQPREALGADPGKPVVARFLTTDGLVIEVSAWRLATGTRVTFLASGEGEAAKEAAALNERLASWVYTLPSHKTEQLTSRLEDLLAPAAT
jgi:hypothetical protein